MTIHETNKETDKQTQTERKQTEKETQTLDICHLQRRLFFCWSDAMAAAIAWGLNEQTSKHIKRKQRNKETNKQTNKQASQQAN